MVTREVSPAELAHRDRENSRARLDATTAKWFSEDWERVGAAGRVLHGRWALTRKVSLSGVAG